MYVEVARIKGARNMPNKEIKSQFDKITDGFHESIESIQAEKDAGFLLYENGYWVQYYEDMSK